MTVGFLKRPFLRVAVASSLVLASGVAAEANRRPDRGGQAVDVRSDRECLARAMYFESRRTDEDGMLAVGTVVANRLAAGGRYGESVCDVVGRPAQFAPGVLTRAMTETRPRALAYRMADVVLGGGRHPVAGGALYFHTADVPFRHDDKRYLLVSGGNAFYAWNRIGGRARVGANLISLARAVAAAPAARQAAEPVVAGRPAAVARAERPAPAVPNAARDVPAADAILAYASALPSPAAGTALAAVAALEPRRPRVVAPAEPAQAAAGPVWPARSGAETRARAWSPSAIANAAVEKAWALFDAVGW